SVPANGPEHDRTSRPLRCQRGRGTVAPVEEPELIHPFNTASIARCWPFLFPRRTSSQKMVGVNEWREEGQDYPDDAVYDVVHGPEIEQQQSKFGVRPHISSPP